MSCTDYKYILTNEEAKMCRNWLNRHKPMLNTYLSRDGYVKVWFAEHEDAKKYVDYTYKLFKKHHEMVRYTYLDVDYTNPLLGYYRKHINKNI